MESWYLYVLAGLVCGIFSASFGVGSGIIMVPALVLAFGLPQKSAQGTCLAVMVPMTLVGALRYNLNPDIEVDIGIVGVLSVGAVAGAVIGASIAGWLPGSVLRRLFAVIMLIVALKLLLTPAPQKPPTAAAAGHQTARPRARGDP